MLRSYKYRVYPNEDQKVLIAKHFGCCRYIYNWALAKKIEVYTQTKKSISRFDLQKELPIMKKTEETIWLSEVYAQSLQYSLENLDKAYTKFFKEKQGYPKFKSKNNKSSYSLPQGVKVDFIANTVKIPKLGNVAAVLSREFTGIIKTVTVSKTPTNKYFVSIIVDDGKKEKALKKISKKSTVGIDTGVKTLLTLSNGSTFENPAFLKKSIDRLKVLQKRSHKKLKGSNNKKKFNLKIAKLHEKITNQRKDNLHKITHELTKENQFSCIVIEDLNVKEMTKTNKPKTESVSLVNAGKSAKSGLNRAILDTGLGTFYSFLSYKCKDNGINLITIGRYEPSSKTCSSCGSINHNLKLQDRSWICKCGISHDRDLNAAINIKEMGLHPKNKTGEAFSVVPMEPPTMVGAMK